MGLAQDLKIIKDAELDIEILNRDNEKKCMQNNEEIDKHKEKIAETEIIIEEELKASGEKKIECKIGYASYRTMPDKWEYDDVQIIAYCKYNKLDFYHTVDVVRKAKLKNEIISKEQEMIPGITVSPQEPKFNYKIK